MNKNFSKFFIKNGYCKIDLFTKKQIDNLRKTIIDRIKFLCPEIQDLDISKLKNFHKNKNMVKVREKLLNPNNRYIKINRKKVLTKK